MSININKGGRPRKTEEEKAKPTDRLTCNICGGTFTRNNRSRHNNTKVHKAISNIHEDVRRIVLNKPEKSKPGFISVGELKYNGSLRRVRERLKYLDD